MPTKEIFPWLIQRGGLKNVAKENIEGIDSLVSYDYMGSAEFEFGALFHSLQRMIAFSNDYSMNEIPEVKTKDGEVMFLYCDKTMFEGAKRCAIQLSKNKYGYKEYCDMVDFIKGKSESPCACSDFWWDIQNDYMIVFGNERAEKVQIAMEKLKEKWAPKLPTKKNFLEKILRKNRSAMN